MKRNTFVETALLWIGRKEADGSHKQIIDVYNSIYPLPSGYRMQYTDAWCAAFVSAVAQNAGCTDIVFPECGCDRMIALYRKAGRWVENDAYTPAKGDIIFYDWDDNGIGDNTGSSDHVGIVAEVNGNNMLIIEGNMSDAVGYRKLAVDARYIRGYGIPAFEDGEETSEDVSETPAEETVETSHYTSPTIKMNSKLWLLKKGMSGWTVEVLQHVLKAMGYNIETDGYFGEATETIVKDAQTKAGLEPDGEVGAMSWEVFVNEG